MAIPSLNEEAHIEKTVRSVLAAASKAPDLGVEIVIVDDGSTDRTAEIARNLSNRYRNVRTLHNSRNIGVGAAIRQAITVARTDRLLIVPGDNDIPAATLELLFRNADLADIVMCYFHNDESRGRSRFLLSNMFMLIYTTAFDLYVQYINGPAVYPVSKLQRLELYSTRFSIIAEINVKLLRQGATFVEVPSYRQMDRHRARSFNLKSLLESARVFCQLLIEVHFRRRAMYRLRPVRIPCTVHLTSAATELANRAQDV